MKKRKAIHLIVLFVFFFVSACSIFKGNKKIIAIEICYDTNAPILNGHNFEINVLAIYSNGKKQEITHKNDCVISVIGGSINKGTITIPNYPTTPITDTILVKANYSLDDQSFFKELKIPYNYLDHLTVSFNGANWLHGSKGKDKGTPLIFRNGNDGETGENGAPGEDGHQLAVYIWKEDASDLYRIKVNDLITDAPYFYTFRDRGFGVKLILNGGRGGNGGDGGDGGTGKDGSISDNKTKEPGNGGNGGSGGTGGNGGNGGSAIIFLHPYAIELQNKISITNLGGEGGDPGRAGEAGQPGQPLDGQALGQKGVKGLHGTSGEIGLTGDPFQLLIEAFEF